MPKKLEKITIAPSEKELSFRNKRFQDLSAVFNCRLNCTCCMDDLKDEVLRKDKVYIHPFFQVLMCKSCLKFYGNGYISPDEDGSDKYCRWCGEGGNLYICSHCPVAICKSCLKRNMHRSIWEEVEKDDWKCFNCNPEPIYELRAVAWALKTFLKSQKKPTKKVTTVVIPEATEDSLHGHLLNGLDMGLSSIKAIQKYIRGLDSKFSGISRRKEVKDRLNITPEIVNKIFHEVKTHLSSSIKKMEEFNHNISSFSTVFSSIIDKLKEEKKGCSESNEKNEMPSSSKRDYSGDEDTSSKRKKDDSSSDKNCQLLPIVNGSKSKSPSPNTNSTCNDADTLSSDVKGKDWAIVKSNDDNKLSEDKSFPKLNLLRIRKVEEVNKMIVQENTDTNNEAASSSQDCEIIELDDDTSDQAETENDQSSSGENHSKEKPVIKIVMKEPVDNDKTNLTDAKNNSDNESIVHLENDCSVDNSIENNDLNAKSNRSTGSIRSNECVETSSNTNEKNKNDKQNSEKLNLKKDSKSRSDPNESCDDIFSDNNVVTSVISSTSDSDDISASKCGNNKKTTVKKASVTKTTPLNKSSKQTDNTSDEDSDIEKLLNTKSLEKKLKLESTYKSHKSKDIEKVKERDETNPKKVKKSIIDYCSEDSDDSVIDLQGEMDSILLKENPLNKKSILNMIKRAASIEEEKEFSPIELSETEINVSSDSENLLKDSDEEKNLTKKKKEKKTDAKDNEKKSNDSAEDEQASKSPQWKKDKLLTMKISDDSDDDVFKKKKSSKSDNRSKKKPIILSDSDDQGDVKNKRNSSESHGDSSSDDTGDDKPKKKRKRIQNASSSSSEDSVEGSGGKGCRKNIRKVLKKDSLQEATQSALKEEEERKKRIAERQKLYNLMMEECENNFNKTVDKLVLDFDVETKEEVLSVDKELASKLKPHQAEGIKFMWDACFETVKKAKKGKGSGCILAHCMGLGKTLQVVTLVHTLLTNDIGIKNVLVLCPLSTVLNWANEFDKWLSNIGSGQDVDVYHMTKVNAAYRANQLREWHRRGGAMILGYNLFRLLINPTKRIKAAIKNTYLETLSDPGPDLVICDEGHLLKNEKTALSKAVQKIKTLRRIVLTGTPLQNNLNEYHCMMQFVKPNLLGTKKEFINRFVNPMENGQFVDSTPHDVKVMKRRAHVLHKMLDGVVQRKAYNVLVPFLPTKFEYVLNLSMTEVQVKLYQHYLDNFSRNSAIGAGTSLFKDRSILGLICAHPRLLIVQKENELLRRDMEETDEEGSLKDFIHDSTSGSSSTPSSSDSDGSGSSKSVKSIESVKRRTTRNTKANDDEEAVEEVVEPKDDSWWSNILTDNDLNDIGSSTKLTLLFLILQKCEQIGDKLLVFTQSLLVLDLIEYFLDIIDTQSHSEEPPEGLKGFNGSWVKGIDYFRLDGKVSSENRTNWCKRFNREDNFRARLFLISTRAGGLGINLTGANRVVLFDASWNPSHDVQSIFRIYRFGQTKPCYVYRFLNKGTMEQKVYDRQVAKLSMSCRVIDEQQIDRHFSFADLNELYVFTPNEQDGKTPPLPKDRLLAELLQEHKECLLWYHTHDSLLENQIDEELNEEERKQAWADFENEKKPQYQNMMSNNFIDLYQRAYSALKEKYPNWQEQEIRQGTMALMMKLQPTYNQNPPNMQNLQVQQQHMMMPNRVNMQTPLQGMPGSFYNNTLLPMPNVGHRGPTIAPRNPSMPYGNMQQKYLPNPFAANAKILPNPLSSNFNNLVSLQPGPSKQLYPKTTSSLENPSSSNSNK